MQFKHSFVSQAGQQLDVLEDTEFGLRIVVSRLGAELISIARRGRKKGSWVGFLWRDGLVMPPKSGWAGHATVMGYYLHRLWNQQSRYGNAVVRGGNHGFLRNFLFGSPGVDLHSGSLVYGVLTERVPKDQYPLRVAMGLEYRMEQGTLKVTFRFKNEETDRKAHVSFGLHPGFAVSSIDTMSVRLPPGHYRRYMAPNNFLNGEIRDFEFSGGPMPFPKEELPGSFLVGLAGVPNRQIVLEDTGRRVNLDFSEVPFFTLWSDLSGFVAIEPCWGLPDSCPPMPFDQKIGIETLEKGGQLVRSFSLRPEIVEKA